MITFTRVTQTQDETTGLLTPVTTTITGEAVQVRGHPQRYAALGLRLDTMPTLLVTPTTYPLLANGDEFVLPGDTVEWTGEVFTVRDVEPVAPDGRVIVARVVVAK
jgi:DNA/RNA endonuclease YhcR with UshA esterase domain